MNNIYFEMWHFANVKKLHRDCPGHIAWLLANEQFYIYNLLYLGDKPNEVEWKT